MLLNASNCVLQLAEKQMTQTRLSRPQPQRFSCKWKWFRLMFSFNTHTNIFTHTHKHSCVVDLVKGQVGSVFELHNLHFIIVIIATFFLLLSVCVCFCVWVHCAVLSLLLGAVEGGGGATYNG